MTDAADPIRVHAAMARLRPQISPGAGNPQCRRQAPHAQLLVGNDSKDDAAVYDSARARPSSARRIFMPIVDDPFDLAKSFR